METQGRLTETERRLKTSEGERLILEGELDDQKDAIQLETTRYQSLVQQVEKLKLETDRRLSEKDDEMEAQKLQQKRQIESLQSVLDENEARNKSELISAKKKLGAELDDALQQCEVLKKMKNDQEVGYKKLQLTHKELSDKLIEEQNLHEMTKDQMNAGDKKSKKIYFVWSSAKHIIYGKGVWILGHFCYDFHHFKFL